MGKDVISSKKVFNRKKKNELLIQKLSILIFNKYIIYFVYYYDKCNKINMIKYNNKNIFLIFFKIIIFII